MDHISLRSRTGDGVSSAGKDSDKDWVLQWWQSKAFVYEQYVRGVRVGACGDPDVVAAPTVVRLLSAASLQELADQACAAWDDVHRLARHGAAPRVLAAVAARVGLAYSSQAGVLIEDVRNRVEESEAGSDPVPR